jgi:putative oxidoreductase
MSQLALFQAAWAPRVLSVVRIMAALLFIEHGTQKLFGWPPPPAAMAGMLENLPPLLVVAAWMELVGGILLGMGLFTRWVAFVLSGQMAAAYFIGHASQGFFPASNGGDAAILFCFIFLYFFFAGPGCWSIDAARGEKTTDSAAS